MSNEITNKMYLIIVNGGIEIWVDNLEKEQIEGIWKSGQQAIMTIGEVMFDTSDIQAIITGKAIENRIHIKKGDWKCKYDKWHDRKEAYYECTCGRQH